MTVQPTRDQLRALALRKDAEAHQRDEHTPDLCGDPECVPTCVVDGVEWPCETAWLRDQLDAAEQRIRDLTQEVRDERGAARDQMEQVRIRDARIQAVEDVLDTWMTYCQTEQTARALSDIRRALNGYTET